jgi:hypothetical protein
MDKVYVEAMIRFLENVTPGDEISRERGQELCGNYWSLVRKELDKSVLMLYEGGGAYVKYDRYLSSTLLKYRNMLESIEKEEADRELDNETKRIGNKYAKRAYTLSILALILSGIAIIVEILSKTVWK